MRAMWVINDLKKDILNIMTKFHKVVINYWTWRLDTLKKCCNFIKKQVTDISLVLKDRDRESENLSLLIHFLYQMARKQTVQRLYHLKVYNKPPVRIYPT